MHVSELLTILELHVGFNKKSTEQVFREFLVRSYLVNGQSHRLFGDLFLLFVTNSSEKRVIKGLINGQSKDRVKLENFIQ